MSRMVGVGVADMMDARVIRDCCLQSLNELSIRGHVTLRTDAPGQMPIFYAELNGSAPFENRERGNIFPVT